MEGYAEAKAKVEAARQHTMDQVCKSWYLGGQYGFPEPMQYSKEETTLFGSGGRTAQRKIGYWEEAYDLDSIMQYPSYHFGDDVPDDHNKWPIAMWKDHGPHFQPPNRKPRKEELVPMIPLAYNPTDEDVLGIKVMYAWDNEW
jgi:starvation-inducible outer membrane lipoprotein